MKRPIIVLALFCLCGISCQQNQTGVQQSLARADESVVVSALKTIIVAEQAYSVSNSGEYATLEQLTKAGHLDERFGTDKPVRDYVLNLKTKAASGNDLASFTCTADPDRSGDRAGRHFFISSASSQIHVNAERQATEEDEIFR